MLVWVTFRLCQDVLSPKGKGHMLREELSLVYPYWSPARWEGALLNNENPPQALQAQLPPPSGVRLQCPQNERLLDVSQMLQTAELREVALPRVWNWAEHPCQNWALLKPQPALRPTTLGKFQALGETVNSSQMFTLLWRTGKMWLQNEEEFSKGQHHHEWYSAFLWF